MNPAAVHVFATLVVIVHLAFVLFVVVGVTAPQDGMGSRRPERSPQKKKPDVR